MLGAVSSLLMGQSTHTRLLVKWGDFLGPGRWDPEPLRQSVLQTQLSHCLPRPFPFPSHSSSSTAVRWTWVKGTGHFCGFTGLDPNDLWVTTNRTVKTRLLLRIPHTTKTTMLIREILAKREELMLLPATALLHA